MGFEQEAITKKLTIDIYVRFFVAFFGLIILYVQKILGFPIKLSQILFVLSIIIAVNTILFSLVKNKKVYPLTEYIVTLLDFFAVTYVIWFTGGLESRFYFIFIIIILVEGLSLNKIHFLYNFILTLILYPSIIFLYYQGLLTRQDLSILLVRLLFITMIGSIIYIYMSRLIGRKETMEKLNQDNVDLNAKLEEFSQILSDEVAKSTEDLRDKIREIERLYKKFRNLFIDFARALGAAIDARDPYTHGHSERVTKYAFSLMEELQYTFTDKELSPEIKETLLISSLLHDIGKISISDTILQKPGPLSPEEWIEMRKHPVIAQNILKPIEDLKAAAGIIRSHHERFDGGGYPDGLIGENIPFLSRVICLADAFDAMTSDRPYRPRLKTEASVEEIKRCAGTQFDPDIVRAFLSAYKRGTLFITD